MVEVDVFRLKALNLVDSIIAFLFDWLDQKVVKVRAENEVFEGWKQKLG